MAADVDVEHEPSLVVLEVDLVQIASRGGPRRLDRSLLADRDLGQPVLAIRGHVRLRFEGEHLHVRQHRDELHDHDVGRFGYYGPWSPAAQAPPITVSGQGPGPTAPAYQNPALKNLLGIEVAIGTYDLGGNAPTLTAITERRGLQNAGVPFRWYSVDGGHTWAFCRLVRRDFLTRAASTATTTSATQVGNTLSASVTAGTAQPAVATGTVQLYVAGQPVGEP